MSSAEIRDCWHLAMWTPSLVTLKSCLSVVVGAKSPGCMGSEETILPKDLENKSKDRTSEAFYSERHKEKWRGSWKGHRDMTGR